MRHPRAVPRLLPAIGALVALLGSCSPSPEERDAALEADSAFGEVRITTADPEAVEAVHAFMAAQRGDHRAAGHH